MSECASVREQSTEVCVCVCMRVRVESDLVAQVVPRQALEFD